MTVDNDINGSLLKIRRESLGWTLADMAVRACLSTKQVRQLEEGGDNSFYSHAIKLTVAKKIALILNVTEDELFFRTPVPLPLSELEDSLKEESLHLEDHLEGHLDLSSHPLPKESVAEKSSSEPASKVLVSSADPKASFASILTRSQSSSEDLDALLLQEDEVQLSSVDGQDAVKKLASQQVHGHFTAPSASELTHLETAGLPSTPSPITLSSASSSLSEDQHSNGQSVWLKLILGILVFIGALLIVAPKSLDGFVSLIESRFKKMDSSIDVPANANIQATQVLPILDTTQLDTPVEAAKAVNSSGLDMNKAPSSSIPPSSSPSPAVSPTNTSPALPNGNSQGIGVTNAPVKTQAPTNTQQALQPAPASVLPGQ